MIFGIYESGNISAIKIEKTEKNIGINTNSPIGNLNSETFKR